MIGGGGEDGRMVGAEGKHVFVIFRKGEMMHDLREVVVVVYLVWMQNKDNVLNMVRRTKTET